MNLYWSPNHLQPILACPQCASSVELSSSAVVCQCCGSAYHSDPNGVLSFRDGQAELSPEVRTFFDRLSEAPPDQILTKAERIGDRHNEFSYDDWFDPRHTDWMLESDFENQTVLELSCGYGSVSSLIARQAASLVIADTSYGRLTAAALTARKHGLDNVIPVRAQLTDLPVARHSVDILVVHGVSCLRPYPVRTLHRFQSLLADGGTVLFRAENQYNFYSLLREQERQRSLSSLLPARIRRFAPLSDRGQPPTCLSKAQCTDLFQRAGFQDVSIRYGVPDFKRPIYIFSDEERLLRYFQEKFALSPAMSMSGMLPTPLVKGALTVLKETELVGQVSPAYFVKATK